MKQSKIIEFLKPTKRKIKAYAKVMLILFILNIFLFIFFGRFSCFPRPCSEGNWSDLPSHFRPYYSCGRCVEPKLMEDIIGYSRHYFLAPYSILLESHFLGGKTIPFFILDMFMWYLFVCFYVVLKDRKGKGNEPFLKFNRFKLVSLVILSVISLVLIILEYNYSQGTGPFAEFLRGYFSYLYLINVPFLISSVFIGNVVGFIIEILILYLIVCLLYSAYNLVMPYFKSKNNNKK